MFNLLNCNILWTINKNLGLTILLGFSAHTYPLQE